MKRIDHPLSYYVDLIEADIPFALARYGDGEFAAMRGVQGANCDGHEYFPDLGEDLRRAVLAKRPYFYAIGPKALEEQAADTWLAAHGVDIQWHNADVFRDASVAGKLYPLVQALRGRRMLYVGPRHVCRLVQEWLACDTLVISASNCYLHKSAILEHIRLFLRGSHRPTIVGLSAGPTANVLVDELWQDVGAVTLIDFGSIWDVYAGVQSRSYMRKGRYDWERLYRINSRGEA